jgi:hypothetical protein
MIEILRGIAEKVGCEIPNAREVRTLSETVDPQRVVALMEEGEDD